MMSVDEDVEKLKSSDSVVGPANDARVEKSDNSSKGETQNYYMIQKFLFQEYRR
jgi:hypothetical protein